MIFFYKCELYFFIKRTPFFVYHLNAIIMDATMMGPISSSSPSMLQSFNTIGLSYAGRRPRHPQPFEIELSEGN